VPLWADAVTGNLTIVGETAAGLIALGPTMAPTGDTTTINFVKGDTRANNVTVGCLPTARSRPSIAPPRRARPSISSST